MITIEPIGASSEDGGDVYRLLVMIHAMAGQCAVAKVDNWQLKATYTDTDARQFITVYSNGIVDVTANSRGESHYYSMKAVEEGEG